MSELKIYTSEGNRVYSDVRGSNDRISEFFFDGVRLYAEKKSRSEVELIVFFRASESEVSRAEQYYAVYQTDTHRDIFSQFTTKLKTKIEDEQKMSLQTTSEDVSVFNSLTRGQSTLQIPAEHEHIESLLREGKQLKFGVSSSTDAVKLVTKYLDNPSQRLAIADDINISELEDCDLLIEIGGYEKFTSIGSTEELLRKKSQKSIINIGSNSSKSKANKNANKLSQIAQFTKVFIAVFVLLVVFLVILGTLTDISFIDAFDINNLIN